MTEKGFYVTNGLNFGADFLAYAEDPLVCHAKYLVRVITTPSLSQNDLIQAERIANQAKKSLLIAFPSAENPRVAFCEVSFTSTLQSKFTF